ncbi:MAG: hypothetical protein ACREJ2_01795 [Planctomycetota bacterium]
MKSVRALLGACTLALFLAAAGCDDPAPPPPAFHAVPETPLTAWDFYVTRHMGRAMGRLQFRVPAGWVVTYKHDTVHPRMIVSDRPDWTSDQASFLVIGMTERTDAYDGPPEVWKAENYSGEANKVKRELLDRKVVVTQQGHMGQSVTWQTTQTSPAIGDWETGWRYGADPGPGAINRDRQHINRFQEYLKAHPGAPVTYFREFLTYGWGAHQAAWLQVYYKARTPEIRAMFERMIPTIDAYQCREVDVPLLGSQIAPATWAQMIRNAQSANSSEIPPLVPDPLPPLPPAAAGPDETGNPNAPAGP